ncbi:MAG: putative sulfate exporter family transporter [Actinomycetota bacterium]|nr:putative sulfate exporter family transporter [Actinomycetota bacterium]
METARELDTPTTEMSGEPPLPSGRTTRLPGALAALAVAAVATVVGHFLPVVGAPVVAIVLGIAVAIRTGPRPALASGLRFCSRTVLQASIVLLGTGLSFAEVLSTGASSLPVLAGTLATALGGAWLIGRALGIDSDLSVLIGVGTGICGASAIAATDAVISASAADVSYAVATIFTFNVAAVLSFPSLGHLLGLGPHAFGLWSGTAVNDMSSVVAASSIFGGGATAFAIVVKLTRTLAIIPITIVLSLWRSRRASAGTERSAVPALSKRLRQVLPVFVGWFLVAVGANSAGLVPHALHAPVSDAAQAMITIALAAIGLSTRARDIARTGARPIALGAALWILVAGVSLGLQAVTGTI